VDAGADFIITQLFFDNNAFFDWKARCTLAGITVPVIAGLMPITTIASLKRMAELAAGTRFPAPLLRAIKRCEDDAESVANVGIHWATEQARDLIDRGVDGIHFYTLNRSDATRRIYRTLGLAGRVGSTATGSQIR
jgi:methylenetetrahydrofolate reductase (NADPH)